ncbi:S46 family peptidase [Shewanella oneidensis MR-1]|uniref:Dipeptidyl-peptidase n=1 Tax=Shewanella oneidensis (strain ATCC 700550 / JCM 31522 / CIP 106686 / LMG 19005 / NCIMB 14063 / MR-1) TaxID=211586 RepID=Q8EHX9_SHEON|nr:S46 family peptidase [Shewanella oneidensis]AAN54147.1 dipeptydil peptidase S46 family [Shewanella oneidensis MR-1]MDX5997053.1 S46 family peptidase [Shewanella oneidensis]MEE2028053.1 Asp/Glu-specific dipeptidyl-peptidase [Shewanella oneidensis]QKG95887.1 S46 family peptidase [Shewanella oneidensis MR-1]
MKKWLLSVAVAASFASHADEGMWQPHQLPAMADVLKAKGLEIDAKSISKLTEFPMNAVISLGGCTASFVSPKGLVVTNHHCAYGSIQYNSTPEKNLLQDGFLAKTFADELPAAPGSRVYVTEDVTNVTERVKAGLENKTGREFYQGVENQEKALVAECEKDEGYRCQVYSFHGGLEYYLVKQLEIRDVRLVYNPAGSVGKYGGDVDNWMWPRHTGDYSFYRAYVSKNGKPAEFSADNVPYEPKSFLKVSAKGVSEGDFVMVAGYPGRTNRYRTATEVQNEFEWAYPEGKMLRERFIEIIKATAPEGSDERIKYESQIAGLANYAKNFTSMIEFYGKSTMLADRKALEAKLAEWIAKDSSREAKYGKTLAELDALIAKSKAHQERDMILSYISSTTMLPTANNLYRLAHEKQLPDMQREPGFQDRDMTRFKASMERIDRRYAASVDKAVLFDMLKRYAALPEAQRLPAMDKAFGIDNKVNEAKLAKTLDKMYAKTELGNKDVRLAWMEKSVDDFKASKDPFIQFAVAMYDTNMSEEKKEKELDGELMKVRPQYMDAIIAYNLEQGKPVYADANSSLRVTVGHVKGYSPKDGLVAVPFTRLEGIVQKDTGIDPFDAPKQQLELIKQKQYGDFYMKSIDSVPVNFLSTLDTTGGNSGSPTLNGRAELVGLLFDGVYESIIGGWAFDNEINRSIHVDSRYMLWVMKYLDHADNLLAEMEIVN